MNNIGYVFFFHKRSPFLQGGIYSENIINNDKTQNNGNSCISAINRIIATKIDSKGDNVTIGKRIRKRRKELNMSVDELARKVGKDRSTIYRYENGDIGNMPLELVMPMVEALDMTPQELLSFFVLKSEWFSERAECFTATEGYQFNDGETNILHEVAKYIINIRNSEQYEEKMNCLSVLFKQLNK